MIVIRREPGDVGNGPFVAVMAGAKSACTVMLINRRTCRLFRGKSSRQSANFNFARAYSVILIGDQRMQRPTNTISTGFFFVFVFLLDDEKIDQRGSAKTVVGENLHLFSPLHW